MTCKQGRARNQMRGTRAPPCRMSHNRITVSGDGSSPLLVGQQICRCSVCLLSICYDSKQGLSDSEWAYRFAAMLPPSCTDRQQTPIFCLSALSQRETAAGTNFRYAPSGACSLTYTSDGYLYNFSSAYSRRPASGTCESHCSEHEHWRATPIRPYDRM